MAKIYMKRILEGQKTLDDVPERLREDVLELLTKAGWKEPEN